MKSLLLEFARNGSSLPVTELVPGQGFVLDNETGAWPRGLAIRMTPVDAGTKVMLKNLQQPRGLPEQDVVLGGLQREGDGLRLEAIAGLPE